MPGPVERIPVSLLTGFLGAGKTTLLNHWVGLPEFAGVAVLVNEFGEVGVDHHLVEALDDQIVLLDSGCLCCAVRGDLVGALKTLALRSARREIAPLNRILIETSGLADPVPLIYTLMEDEFVSARFVCDGVATVVSATHGLDQLRAFQEASRQVIAADLLFITKGDLASAPARDRLRDELQALNPCAPQHWIRDGRAEATAFLACGYYKPAGKLPSLVQWLGEEAQGTSGTLTSGGDGRGWLVDRNGVSDAARPAAMDDGPPEGRELGERWRQRRDRASVDPKTLARHASGVSSFTVVFDKPVPWVGFAVALGRILVEHAAQLLRTKGLVAVAGTNRPQVIQCVQGSAYPSVALPTWPQEGAFQDGRGRLVFITRHLGAEQVEAIRRALQNLPDDALALRMSAGDSMLPTRCWLAQQMPLQGPGSIEHDGWFIQPRRFVKRPRGN